MSPDELPLEQDIWNLGYVDGRKDAARLDRTLERAIDDAARDLPEGWEIQIRIENGGFSVELFDPMMKNIDIEDDGCSITEAVNLAVEAATGEQ